MFLEMNSLIYIKDACKSEILVLLRSSCKTKSDIAFNRAARKLLGYQSSCGLKITCEFFYILNWTIYLTFLIVNDFR